MITGRRGASFTPKEGVDTQRAVDQFSLENCLAYLASG
jgi:hypothetical protein